MPIKICKMITFGRNQTLCVVAVLALTIVPKAWAQEVRSRLDFYQDEWIVVFSNNTSGRVDVSDKLSIDAAVGVDVVSGATQVLVADAITGATEVFETRHEGALAGTYKVDSRKTLTGQVVMSVEPDYRTQAFSVGFSTELLDQHATLTGSYAFSDEMVGLADDSDFGEAIRGHQVDVGWSHVLGRRTKGSFRLTLNDTRCGPEIGCQANPYRFVPLNAADLSTADADAQPVLTLRERHPDRRTRVAGAMGLSHSFATGYAIHGSYRYYADTWDVRGHTLEVAQAASYFGERLLLEAKARFVRQSAAAFFGDSYSIDSYNAALPSHRTADRELSALFGANYGAMAQWSFSEIGPFTRLSINLRLAHLRYTYDHFSELPNRRAFIFGTGLGAQF